MGKKKVFLKKLGKIITAPVKFISKLPRETCRILDQGLDIGDKAIKKTGLNKVLGGASVGVSTSSGSRGGSNAYYKPAGSAHAVGAGLSNSGNASLFIDNNVAASLTTLKFFANRSANRTIRRAWLTPFITNWALEPATTTEGGDY